VSDNNSELVPVIDNTDMDNAGGIGNNTGKDTAADTDMVAVADNPAVVVDMVAVVVVLLGSVLLVLALFLLVLYLDNPYNKNYQPLKFYTRHKVIFHIKCN
jgi:hypothetical protein